MCTVSHSNAISFSSRICIGCRCVVSQWMWVWVWVCMFFHFVCRFHLVFPKWKQNNNRANMSEREIDKKGNGNGVYTRRMWCNFGCRNWEKERMWDGIANETHYEIKKVNHKKERWPTNRKGLKKEKPKRKTEQKNGKVQETNEVCILMAGNMN